MSRSIHPFALLFLFFLSTPSITQAIEYRIIDLGRFDCLYASYAHVYGINEYGNKATGASCSDLGDAAFIWDAVNGMQYIGTLGSRSLGLSINNNGQITGTSRLLDSSQEHAFLWDPSTGMLDLGTLGGDVSVGRGINNIGQVVGDSYFGPNPTPIAFLWDNVNGMQTFIETVDGWSSTAFDVNDQGQITGQYNAPGEHHAYIWDPTNGMQTLGSLGPGFSLGAGINNNGQVVGSTATMEDTVHAFLWDATNGMQDIGTLGGAYSRASDINDHGQIVGSSDTGSGESHAFLWDIENGMQDLCVLARCTESGWDNIDDAQGIANNGSIVATGEIDGESYAVLIMINDTIFSDGFEDPD